VESRVKNIIRIEDVQQGVVINEGRFIVSECNKDIQIRTRTQIDRYKSIKVKVRNDNLGPVPLTEALGLKIVPHTDGSRIGTADTEGQLGWRYWGGYSHKVLLGLLR